MTEPLDAIRDYVNDQLVRQLSARGWGTLPVVAVPDGAMCTTVLHEKAEFEPVVRIWLLEFLDDLSGEQVERIHQWVRSAVGSTPFDLVFRQPDQTEVKASYD